MSYADTTRLLSSKLMQPSKIGILTSVGFHALLLGIALPKIDWTQTTNRGNEGIVPIIKLNTLEQTRLPDTFVEPELDIPAFPNTPIDNNPLLNFPSVVELDQDAIANLPASPPPIKYIPPSVPPAIQPQTDQLPNSQTQANLPLPPPPIEVKPDNSPQPTQNSSDDNQPLTFPPSQVEARIPQPPPPTENNQSETESNTAANTDSLNQPSDSAQPLDEIAAAKEQKYQNLLAQLRNKQQSLRYEVDNTSEKEYRDNYLQFASSASNPEIESISIEAAYPQDACIQQMEGTSIYGAMVDANGQVTNLELLKNSGYGVLNQQASQAISSTTFNNPTGQTKPYEVTVKFEYQPDACPSIYSEYSDGQNQPPTTNPTEVKTPPQPQQPTTEEGEENTQPASTPNNQENNSSVDSTSSETESIENNTPSQSEDSTVTNDEDSDNQVKPQTEAEVNDEASQSEQNLPVINQDNQTPPPTEGNTPQTQSDSEDSATSESTEETRSQPNQNSGVQPHENQQVNQSNSETETESENRSQPSDTEASTTVPDSWGEQPIRIDGQN